MPQDQFLILLVGSNPLPNYLVAYALRPSRIAFMYTNETEEAKNRLRKVLTKVDPKVKTTNEQKQDKL